MYDPLQQKPVSFWCTCYFVVACFVPQIDGQTDECIQYREIPALVHRFAAHLRAQGLRKGDVLCVFASNHIHYPIVSLATQLLGGIVTDINPSYTKGSFQ